jgi:hypothetical protein
MAVYKHSGFSDGQKQFEWFSDNADPTVTNPYKDGRYPNLTFQSVDATPAQEAEHLAIQAESALLTDRKARLVNLVAAKDIAPGSLTNVQRDKILIYLLKRELGE